MGLRNSAFFLILICSLALRAEGFHIITSGGFQGIADDKGTVVIPAVYEMLGWSDGSKQIIDETIGYAEAGKWGLIDIKEKKITDARYATLKPCGESLFEAGITGRFSNLIFRGLIDKKAKVKIGFRFFSIDPLSEERLKVSQYKDGSLSYGVITAKGEYVIPLKYKTIEKQGELILAGNILQKHQIYDLNGSLVFDKLVDNLEVVEEGYRIQSGGKYGLIGHNNQVVFPMEYKSIEKGKAAPFAKWEVRSHTGGQTFNIDCDSITYHEDQQLLIAHLNDVSHILDASSKLFEDQEHILKSASNGFLVTQNARMGTWGIYKTNGESVVGGFDSVAVDQSYFYTKNEKGWDLYNFFGRKINAQPYESIAFSAARNVPVKKDGYWGWIDFQGDLIQSFKYDSIIPVSGQHFFAHYLKGWGVGNVDQINWVVMPEYDSVYRFHSYYVAKRGMATYLYNLNGKKVLSIPFQVIPNGFLKLAEGGKYGLITSKGLMIEPEYDHVEVVDGYYKLVKEGSLLLVDADGRVIIKQEDEIGDVLAFSEEYFLIQKDNKMGFVDLNGKLRVANRYDDALPYHEGLAPVQLLGRWGFIDKYEILEIQPYYKKSTNFKDGLAVVQIDENYGVINRRGEEVIEARWKDVELLPTGNYLITDWDGKQGLISSEGTFILRPNYEALEDSDLSLVIATRSSKMGVLDYSGYTKVPIIYDQIKIRGDYLLLLKDDIN